MAIEKRIINMPIGGMDLDSFPSDVKPSDVTLRVNGGYGTKRYNRPGDVPDMANVMWITGLPNNIVGRATVPKRNFWVIFSVNDGSEIGIANWETKQYTKIATDKEFRCDWGFNDCEEINIEYDFKKGCRDLMLYFSSKYIYYHINLDELLDPRRKKGLKDLILSEGGVDECQKYDCSYFRNFKCVCGIKSNLKDTGNGGYNLPAGVYQVFVRLEDRNGTPSNIFTASSQLNIGSEDNIPGQRSNSCIEIHLSNLPCNFHLAEIILASKVGGYEKAVIVARRIYNNRQMSYTYCGKNNEEITINPEELRYRGRVGFEGSSLKIKNNKMYYYNILPIKNPDLQKRVIEETKVKLKPFLVPYKDVVKYQLTSLQRSERYMFSANFNTCEYGPTPAYVLAPTGGGLEYEDISFAEIIKASQSQMAKVEYVNGKVIRIQSDCKEGSLGNTSGGGCGRGANCGLCNGGGGDIGDGGSGCGRGNNTCIGYRGQYEEQEKEGYGDGYVGSSLSSKIEEDINNTDTSAEDVKNVIDCTPKNCIPEGEECGSSTCDECECEKNSKAAKEYEDTIVTGAKNAIIDWMDRLASYAKDGYDPSSRSSSIKEAALNLINKAVKKREQVYQSTDKVKVTRKVVPELAASPGNTTEHIDQNICDKTVDSYGNVVLNAKVDRTHASFPFIIYETANKYPDTLNCYGEPIYGSYAGKPIQLFEVPPASKIPLFLNNINIEGVPSNLRPDGSMYDQQLVVLLGLDIEDLPIPTDQELGATLCKDNPVSINQIERDPANSRVLGKGMAIGGYFGNVHGEKFLYSKHAVNSPEYVDRYIDDSGSRKGIGSSSKHMFLHSLDLNIYHLGLAPTHLQCEGIIKGSGERYGLAAMGPPPNDRFIGRRVDMKGARSAINFSYMDIPPGHIESDFFSPLEIDGITYVAPDGIVKDANFDIPIMNKGKEGIVAIQSSKIKDLTELLFDYSFLGVTIDHKVPAKGRSLYVSLLRENPDQYGTLISQPYVLLGLEGNNETYKTGKISGICGDIYVGLDTVRRTSYISDKVGEEYPIGAVVDGKVRSRTVCDPPDNWDFNENGAWNPHELPKSGDMANAKNWAGLRTTEYPLNYYEVVATDVDDDGLPTDYALWRNQNSPSDVFYFGTLTHLNMFWAETRVCPWLRQTGEGSQVDLKKVFFPNLKDLVLDSTFLGGSEQFGVDWNKGWLNEYHLRVEQPSKAQLAKVFFLKMLINFITPIGYALLLAQVETSIGAASAALMTPILVAIWTYVKLNYFTDERIFDMVGIANCRTDAEGAGTDRWVEGLQDNYWKYNWDYSENLKIDVRFGLPDPYYTCNCEKETVNYIIYSAISREGIDADGYLSVSPFNKIEIPTHTGKLQLLFENENGFYAITTDRILILSEPPTSLPTISGGSIQIGGASNIQEPRPLFHELNEGRIGILDPNSSIATPWGQLIIDEVQRQIFLFSGRYAEPISDYRARRWFQENLAFKCKGCRDEKQEYGYSAGIDYVNEMIFITKHDCECSWTLGYSVKNKWWHSFYTFKPYFYFWNRANMFTFENGEIWKHTDSNKHLSYYGKSASFIIEIALYVKAEYGLNMPITWLSTTIDTTVKNNELLDTFETFNSIAIHGELVSTGQNQVKILEFSTDRYKRHVDDKSYVGAIRNANKWNVNDLRNYLDDNMPPVNNKCPYDSIAAVTNNDKVPKDLYGDYLLMRLEYSGEKELITKSILHRVDVRMDG